ncbi:MAG: aminotransferase class V-fold PLP-dependent enzyme [Deltaproteobacteria bacterium]|nr:aminotransferase class V-fold PLP-dependent enzyme [Deltaproteobacteria bacterium]
MKRAIVLADKRSPKPINGSGHLKALAKVGGLPLIIRNLRTLRSAGIEEAVVVTGYQAERIRTALDSYHVGIPVTVVHNSHWHLGPAPSVLSAAGWIDGQVVLVPSDHLYPPSLVRRIINCPAPADAIVLAVARRRDEVFDEQECLKVKLSADRVTDVAMTMEEPDGICSGIVRISPQLVEILGRLIEDVEISVVDALRAMARRGRLRALEVENARWISISSPQARRYADLLLKLHGDTLETSYEGEHPVLLNPGPVATTPRVKAAVGARDMCHREPIFSDLLDAVQRKLHQVFRAPEEDYDVLVATVSGTGGLESAVSTFVPHGKTLLVLRNGAFGERIAEIAETLGIDIVEIGLPWGRPIPLDRVEQVLDDRPDIGAVAMIHHETSVGILNPLAAVGQLARARGVTFIVDAVSSLGAEDLDVVRDQIDVCVSSANKCLHALSGLAEICVRKAVWPSIEDDRPRSYYLDLRKYRNYMQSRRQTPFTPAVNTVMSLNAALDELLETGVEERRNHYKRLNERLRKGMRSLGLELMVDPERASHSLTLVKVPDWATYQEIYQGLKERGFIVYESKDQLAGKTFQVANMGALEEVHVDSFLSALGQVLDHVRRESAPATASAGGRIRLVSN